MNSLSIGFFKSVTPPPKGGYLFLDDEVPEVPRARVFDPATHSFNPLTGIDYKRAREIAELLYTISPQGDSTLTVRNGKRAMLKALLHTDRLDRVEGDDEVRGLIDDLLMSPVLKRVLCNPTNFSFNPRSIILAKIDRVVLSEFDALVLGLFLITHFKGQLVIPDFGFYGRDIHTRLVREDRLIAGVNFLNEVPDKLRRSLLLIEDKTADGATFEDAQTLAKFARLLPGTNGFNDFIDRAMV